MEEFTKIVLMIIAAWLTAELIKAVIESIKYRKMNLRIFLSFGGFPSVHSTLVTSLAVSIFLIEGLSISLIISLVLFSLVIRDIIAIRESIDKHSTHISLLSDNKIVIEKISHSILEIVSGILIGIIMPLIIHIIFNLFNL